MVHVGGLLKNKFNNFFGKFLIKILFILKLLNFEIITIFVSNTILFLTIIWGRVPLHIV